MNISRRTLLTAGATTLMGAAVSGNAWADVPAAVRGVLVQASGASSRVTIALDRPATARTFFLADPHRFVIDLANTTLALPGTSGEGPGGGVVRRYRYAPRPDGISRLVLDLEAPASLMRQELGGRRSPEVSFDLAPNAPFVAAPQPVERPGRSAQRRTIVIDAGHGGRDPGAVGVTGVREKDVVLDAALKLRDALESRGNYRVRLTRDADNFIPLEQRVQFSRAQNADLFISVHADANHNRETQGASVYTLSERGEARAQGMMNAQNWDLDLGDAPRQGVTHDILVDLAQRETTNRSAQFAQVVIPRLGEVAPLLRNTHRNAGLFVLLAPDVPAVLIETGFLSNVTDERRLSDPNARERMANAMAGAVDAYFAAPQTYASA
ncbi:N-acetylmuramoyl-L-alanine amidase [Terricaulis silvestris]|uniref:N-acetylmuramoyl-L-alanine amidase n=1 Tax=Terricaulis silvestris TaxID=2686094 RepID=A0A6I6MW56_9CAUL|nr:N-acetylmuramoyl-L-alanine amidase [Terricaulis silvestris]QGZ95413.1 N-acetylmuramoyl-L-alanine amidase AmiC precursor [Terricaulis silvestris]